MKELKMNKIYCPYCMKQGRDKLLFQTDSKTNGTIIIKCRGCRNLIKVEIIKGYSI